ncbi:dynamin family protein [Salinicoccus roseus]|uniref:dynamin family protein n=1 Tax=Salinicoccus roseus TaxID=45670 RepID=UPI00230198D0|nr:dynamin family protein [Salinicoccus roseus]
MNNFQNVLKARETMNQSPLRKSVKSASQVPFNIEEELLRDELYKMDKLIENIDSSLKVVIMGEVKAGKSTLLNAFAGSNISPTDIAEATGAVIEIKYHPESYGKIYLEDKTVEDKPEEIFKELKNNNNNQEFFNKCEGVEFGFPLPNLKDFTLVDTPGLETITEGNSNRTKEYITKTDVVIWVFNGHHLGQSDIEEALIEVNRFGKPIIAVINRIDEIDEDPELLIEYLDEEIGIYVEEIIAVSAYKASNAVLSEDTSLLSESGFSDLIEYIGENISSNSKKVKKDIIINSAQALLSRDLLIHEEYLKTIEFLENQIEKIKEKIYMYSEGIYRHIQHQFEEWYQNEFLLAEKEDLKKTIQDSGIISLNKKKNEVDSQLQSIFSKEYISEKLNEKTTSLDGRFINEWEETVEKVKRDVQIEINQFKKESEKRLELKIKNIGLKDEGSDLIGGASKGAWLGGATGAASAFYAAVLGPAAASVTAGMAVSAFLPPMLIVGATVGAVSTVLKFKSEKSLAEKNVDDAFENGKEEIKQEVLYWISDKYLKQNEHMVANINSLIISALANGVKSEEIGSLKMKIEKYLFENKKSIEEIKLIEA